MSKDEWMGDFFDKDELPFQTHSRTSRAGARRVPPPRATNQERWVYETLQQSPLADWQLWRLAEERVDLFDQISSMRRARVGLVWVNRKTGPTAYHPVEDSGVANINPDSGVESAIWQIKPFYRGMPYEKWVESYKALAREARE